MVDLAVVWQLQRLLQLRLQRRLDRIVPLKIQATVGVDLKGFIHPAEVAIVVGIEQVLGVIEQFALVQVEVDGPAVVIPLLFKRRRIRRIKNPVSHLGSGLHTPAFRQVKDA